MGEVRVTGLKRALYDFMEGEPDKWFTIERLKDELAFRGFRVGKTGSIGSTCAILVKQYPNFFQRQENSRGIYRYHESDPTPVGESRLDRPTNIENADGDIIFLSEDGTTMLVKFDKRIWKCVVVMDI